jgi:hypothetical protein
MRENCWVFDNSFPCQIELEQMTFHEYLIRTKARVIAADCYFIYCSVISNAKYLLIYFMNLVFAYFLCYFKLIIF